MGRWDDNNRSTGGGWGRKIGIGGGRINRIRTTKRLIMIGFVIVAAVVLTIFLSRGDYTLRLYRGKREWEHYKQSQ